MGLTYTHIPQAKRRRQIYRPERRPSKVTVRISRTLFGLGYVPPKGVKIILTDD